jgi:hypothetical protein
MCKILSLTKIADQAQEEDSHLWEGGEEEDPRDSRITTHEISIMEEDITLKGVQKPRRTSQEFSKRKL